MANAPTGGMTAGLPASGSLFVSVYNDQQHFSYRDDFGNLQDAWYGTDGWHLQQLTTALGLIASEWVIPTPGPPPAGDVFVSVYNGQQHFAYRDAKGNIQDAWYGTDGWHLQQLTQAPATEPSEYVVPHPGPPAAGHLFVSVYNDQQHFTYIDSGLRIQDVWYGTDGWHLQQLTEGPPAISGEYIVTAAGPPPRGGLFVSVYNNQQHFAYIGSGGSIQDVWYGTDGWSLQQLTEGPAAISGEYVIPTPGPPAAGNLFVSVYNDQQHFTYLDTRGNVQDVWYGSDGWHRQQLTQPPAEIGGEYVVPTPGPRAAGDLFVSVYNNQQHFAYRDTNGNIQDVWSGTDGWHLQQLTQPPTDVRGEYVIPTPGPLSVGDLAVSVYNDQQHFAYRDANGTIQDAWYGTDGWHLQQINNGVTWTRLANSPGNTADAMWLMQDGTVLLCLGSDAQTLQFLHPDAKGSYADGRWSNAGKFLLQKANFASAVLSDGRLLACGGEQSGPGLPTNDTNFCEIYDPIKQSSTQLSAPTGWTAIGDAPSVVLPDGTFMLGDTQGNGQGEGKGSLVALLDPAKLTWSFGVGDNQNEQGYVLLQTGDVLTADVYDQKSQRYDPSGNAFVQDANVPVTLGAGNEIGPGIALMDGRVIWFGASGHTAIYKPGAEGHNGSWVQGPDLPTMADGSQLVCNDSTAILEPNGKVLVATWWGGPGSVVFLEYDPPRNEYIPVIGAPRTANREATKMLLLPNGHGLVSISKLAPGDDNGLYDVPFASSDTATWAPVITSFPTTAAPKQTVKLTGAQLCGLSECQHFGDDNQQAENYPMVRFVDAGGGVTYARAHDVSTRSIAPRQASSVLVDIPGSLPPGTYSVEAVAMGIPSEAATVTIA
jgi:hypothetical protein